jgi:replicative DNA helicase
MKKDFDKLEEKEIKIEGLEIQPAKDYLEDYFKGLGDGTIEYLGIRTGLKQLDKKTLGLDGLIVLGGIAGQGKTSLALQLAYDTCKLGTPIIFYSLEMPRRAIFTKILNRLAKIKYTDILLKGKLYLDQTGQDRTEEFNKAKEELKEISDRFYLRSLADKTKINFENVKTEINLVKAEHKTEKVLVVIDHLQVFNVDKYRDQIDKEGQLITRFKEISERTGATILLISQKNKAGLNTTGLQTIKGSVDIIYLADLVMFLEEEKEKDNVIAEYGKLKKIDLVISKNRYNAPCRIELDFNGEHSDFTERDNYMINTTE